MKFIAPQGKAALESAFSKAIKKNYFCTGLARQAQQTNQERFPFICTF
jgi:hypothetical protein